MLQNISQQIFEYIQPGKTLDEVFDNIYDKLQTVIPHNRLGLALIDEATSKLVQVKTKSDRLILLDNGFSANIEGSSLETLLASGEARIVNDLQQHFAKRPSLWTKLILDEEMRSSLTLPLKIQDKPIGVVFFTSIKTDAFLETHIGFLQQIVGQLSILIEKGRWISELTQSHERYRLLLEMSNDAIFICSSWEEPFVTFNENLSLWLEYSHHQLYLLSPCKLMRASEWQRIQNVFKQSKTPLTFKTDFIKRSGSSLPLEIRLAQIEYKEKCYLQAVARNLSEVNNLNEQLRGRNSFRGIIGKNNKMQEIYQLIEQLSDMPTTVLIQGPSGTGKELVAQAIHEASNRRDKPFIIVNCGALPENLLENELFGHVKGAFTGAISTREGYFEAANDGTMFLDEIGELSLYTQVKLLRILQQGTFQKIGSTETQQVNVRIITATNRDLKKEIVEGRFREDLYYRLNVFPITLPALCERRDDIPLLVRHFIDKFTWQTEKNIDHITPEALDCLLEYPYPGNVRELENIIEHSFVKCQTDTIETQHLPQDISHKQDDIIALALGTSKPLLTLERELLYRVLNQHQGKMIVAAKHLGISRTTLWRKLQRFEEDEPTQ